MNLTGQSQLAQTNELLAISRRELQHFHSLAEMFKQENTEARKWLTSHHKLSFGPQSDAQRGSIANESVAGWEKQYVADLLQNNISQTLAAVLLLLQLARQDATCQNNLHLKVAEEELKSSLQKLVELQESMETA